MIEIIGYLAFLFVGYWLGSRRQDTKKEARPLVKLLSKNHVKILHKRQPKSEEQERIEKIEGQS